MPSMPQLQKTLEISFLLPSLRVYSFFLFLLSSPERSVANEIFFFFLAMFFLYQSLAAYIVQELEPVLEDFLKGTEVENKKRR